MRKSSPISRTCVMSVIAMMLLFVALQPGVLLTLPAVGRSVFMSGKMSVQAVMVHALIFALVVHFFRRGGYFEGFRSAFPNAAPWTAEGFTDGFAIASPTASVVKETAGFAAELVSPTITSARITKIENYVLPKSENTKIQQIDRILYATIGSMIPIARARVSNSASMPAATKSVVSETKTFASELISPTISLERFNKITTYVTGKLSTKLQPVDRLLYQTIAVMIPPTGSRLAGPTSSSSRLPVMPSPIAIPRGSSSAAMASQISTLKNLIPPSFSMPVMPSMRSGSGMPLDYSKYLSALGLKI